MNKIGVIGSAVVGQTLAQGFRKHGYDVARDRAAGAAVVHPRFPAEPVGPAFKVLWK